MGKINKHGLDRYVPQQVRREIRRHCGFGCVVCGLAYYDYEHFDPDFKDAKTHDPAGMTLLCSQCNQKRARGTLSAESVAKANKHPKCKEQGFASEFFDFSNGPINVNFAGVSFYDCGVLIRVNGVDLLSFKPPEEPGAPVRLSGILSDVTGSIFFEIVDNVWSVSDENWDVEVKGRRTTIRRKLGDIALQFCVSPPHSLTVEKINMEFKGGYLKGDEQTLFHSKDGTNWGRLAAVGVSHCDVGIGFE